MSPDIKFVPESTGTTNEALERLSSIDPRLSRTNYFDGQLLQASDLTRDQIYLDERVLELGQALGSGVASGLDVSLVESRMLHVEPGLAVAPSGRVLQLSKALDIDLLNSAFIATLNQGAYRRLQRGLYAVVLQYVEVIDGVAEAYPADLASRRKAQVSSYAEGVEVTLVPLNVSFQAGDGLGVRSALVRTLITGGAALDLPSDEAVALGMLAIDRTRPVWLDRGLLRRPLRPTLTPDGVQRDLAAHYQELLEDVLAARLTANQRGGFPAAKYFRVLPPWGPIPKEAIDPVKGSQLYFPKDYDVAIAPVRRDDLPALLEESVRLAPMDLERDADADVMVLVPLGDSDFALRARQLELPPEFIERSTGKLARINALALRLFALPQVHRLDTDADTWRAIWDLVRPEELVYVRRPPRTAETNVSAVVLAKGMPLPPPGSGPLVDGAALESQLDAALEKAAGLQATVADLQIKDADQKKRIADLEQSLALGNDVRLAEALAKAADLDGQVQALQAKVQGLESGERNAAILSTALAAATDKITQLSGDLERAQKRIAELQATGATLPDDVQKRIDALTQQVSDLNQTIRTLQAGAEDGAAHLNEAKLKIDQLSAQLDEAKRALGDSGTALAARTAERDAALAESAQAKVDLGNAQDQVNRQQVALDQTQKALQAAQDDRTAANNALAKALDQVNGQQLALAEAQKALQTALDDKANATQALAASQKNVTDLQASLGTSQARATSLESSVNALQARCDDLAAQLKAQSTSPLVRELGALETSNPDALATLQRMVAKNVLENANSLGIPSTSLDRWKKLAG